MFFREWKVRLKYSKAEIFELLKTFISNPWNIWEKGNLLLRKNVLRMALKEPLADDRENNFRTPQVPEKFQFLEKFISKCEMAHRRRFELLTPRFVVWCSIQLSYRCGSTKQRKQLPTQR